jgi:hypothetical protein
VYEFPGFGHGGIDGIGGLASAGNSADRDGPMIVPAERYVSFHICVFRLQSYTKKQIKVNSYKSWFICSIPGRCTFIYSLLVFIS